MAQALLLYCCGCLLYVAVAVVGCCICEVDSKWLTPGCCLPRLKLLCKKGPFAPAWPAIGRPHKLYKLKKYSSDKKKDINISLYNSWLIGCEAGST